MRVLFTHSYFLHLDPKQVAHAQPYPPLGTILAAAVLREQGYTVQLFDVMFARQPEAIQSSLDAFKPDVLVVYDDGFNYLTKMCLSNMRQAAFRMQELAKERGCRVIVTSSDAADHYASYLQHHADVVIIGEAENTLLELCNSLKNGHPSLSSVKGIAYEEHGTVQKTPPRGLQKNLDAFPLPAWDLVDFAPYRQVWLNNKGYFSVNIATTRGCPFTCNWCAKPMYGNAYHMRSTDQVIAEINLLRSLVDFEHVWFCDDIFGLKRSWVSEFAQKVNQETWKIHYKIQSRADLLVQEKYVEDLAASGCEEVWMGAESGSQKVLDAMEKGTKVEEIKQARMLLKTHGIRAAFFIQYGYPGETFEDIQLTLELIREMDPDDIGISVSYPLPGTAFYEKVKHELVNKSNWTDSDDLDLMFSNTYAPTFYKVLHRYTHSMFRKQKAVKRMRHSGPAIGRSKAFLSFVKHGIRQTLQWRSLTQSRGNTN